MQLAGADEHDGILGARAERELDGAAGAGDHVADGDKAVEVGPYAGPGRAHHHHGGGELAVVDRAGVQLIGGAGLGGLDADHRGAGVVEDRAGGRRYGEVGVGAELDRERGGEQVDLDGAGLGDGVLLGRAHAQDEVLAQRGGDDGDRDALAEAADGGAGAGGPGVVFRDADEVVVDAVLGAVDLDRDGRAVHRDARVGVAEHGGEQRLDVAGDAHAGGELDVEADLDVDRLAQEHLADREGAVVQRVALGGVDGEGAVLDDGRGDELERAAVADGDHGDGLAVLAALERCVAVGGRAVAVVVAQLVADAELPGGDRDPGGALELDLQLVADDHVAQRRGLGDAEDVDQAIAGVSLLEVLALGHGASSGQVRESSRRRSSQRRWAAARPCQRSWSTQCTYTVRCAGVSSRTVCSTKRRNAG